MVPIVFVKTYLTAAGIFLIVMALAKGDRLGAFKSISAGLIAALCREHPRIRRPGSSRTADTHRNYKSVCGLIFALREKG
jgi:hypothetical protein